MHFISALTVASLVCVAIGNARALEPAPLCAEVLVYPASPGRVTVVSVRLFNPNQFAVIARFSSADVKVIVPNGLKPVSHTAIASSDLRPTEMFDHSIGPMSSIAEICPYLVADGFQETHIQAKVSWGLHQRPKPGKAVSDVVWTETAECSAQVFRGVEADRKMVTEMERLVGTLRGDCLQEVAMFLDHNRRWELHRVAERMASRDSQLVWNATRWIEHSAATAYEGRQFARRQITGPLQAGSLSLVRRLVANDHAGLENTINDGSIMESICLVLLHGSCLSDGQFRRALMRAKQFHEPMDPVRFQQLVRELDSDRYSVRDKADAALRSARYSIARLLPEAIAQAHSSEQEARLRRISTYLFKVALSADELDLLTLLRSETSRKLQHRQTVIELLASGPRELPFFDAVRGLKR